MPALAHSRLSIGPALVVVLAIVLAGCGSTGSPTPAASVPTSAPSDIATPPATPAIGEVIPAPGSTSTVYGPNPSAIVVAIDPGHGGCLDWGVPNPWDNTVTKAEKADTLAIGLALRDLLEAQGITVVMTRTDDSALAGDNYPQLGCNGPDWRDVDGNGEAGFEENGRTRTRDELQARIDLANLARADVLLSIHINSITQDGVVYQIAVTETYYDDETPWGVTGSGALGTDVQAGVVSALASVTDYERQDRGTEAVAYYIVSRQWDASDTCETPGDTWCKPHRGSQMPAILSEVGSMSLPAESELLATNAGRETVARGLLDGLGTWFGQRQLAVRYDALVPGGDAGVAPIAVPGSGPPFWLPEIDPATAASGLLPLRLTNTGQAAWPSGLRLMAGWSAADAPYLAAAPALLEPVDVAIPALVAGESVTLQIPLRVPTDGARSIAWITLSGAPGDFSALGSPALQLSWRP